MDISLYETLCAAIDEDRLANRLIEMISIRSENPFDSDPSPGFREKEMGEYYADRLSKCNMEVTYRDVTRDRPNVFGHLKGTQSYSSLMLAGHMDTAPTDGYDAAYDTKRLNGKIYGRGACDMKAALAVYLEVIHIIHDSQVKLKGDLLIAGIMDEEHKMLGSLEIGKNGPRVSQGIIGEPSNLDICPCNKGQLGTIIRTLGKPAHSSMPENGINAIVHMAHVIKAFENYNEELLHAKAHPLLGCGRFSPGVISGGTVVSTVPDCCELEVDRRVLPGETMKSVYNEYRSRLDELMKRLPDFKYELTDPTWNIPPNDIPLKEPIVQSALKGYQHVMGKSTSPTAFVASTDAPHMGFPTLICGPGNLAQAHSDNEFVELKQMLQATKIYLWTILDLLG